MDYVKFFDIIGIDSNKRTQYSIRFNKSLGSYINVMDAYYQEHDLLMKHVSQSLWTGGRRHKIHTPKVVQFIQLQPNDPYRWVFIGSFSVGPVYGDDNGNEFYELKPEAIFEKFAARIVVTFKRRRGQQLWTFDLRNPVFLTQIENNMIVEKLVQSPISANPFPGYENVRLTHKQLVAAVANDEWRAALGSVQAVYLQTDLGNGWHYVGSAYSHKGAEHGLLSRWEEYAQGDHTGGNNYLQDLSSQYIENNFQYSILEIFDMHKTATDIISREHWWMDTLSSVRRKEDFSPHGYNTVVERKTEKNEPTEK
jgi:hypothetical protein